MADTRDITPAPRSKDDGIAIFAHEHWPNGRDFLDVRPDPPKVRPICPTCQQPAQQVSHATMHRILHRHGVTPS